MAQISNSTLLHTEGIQQVKDALVVLVKTEWNALIVNELENGCLNLLHQYGIRTKTIVVPGAVEIPFAIQHYQQTVKKKEKADAFVALGCVVRGDTPHFEYVCQSVTQGITQLNVTMDVPSIFGVLTVNTQSQAEERIGGVHGHKGEEAGITAMKMILLSRLFKRS
ncbi:MAG TPA: 6,7-dimethyl-8-ribityllumazine synthase [Flavisolibacter sp.]|jgi:6,7-dimethyl-8-ribityllumazine synthase|nr:6,7-dimethyl-8-ribityllumazine synthase [Flavisolibacter sp.]